MYSFQKKAEAVMLFLSKVAETIAFGFVAVLVTALAMFLWFLVYYAIVTQPVCPIPLGTVFAGFI